MSDSQLFILQSEVQELKKDFETHRDYIRDLELEELQTSIESLKKVLDKLVEKADLN